MSYPRDKCNGVWAEFADTCEEEVRIINEYFEANPPRDKKAVRLFIKNSKKGDNEIVDVLKSCKFSFHWAYWGYAELHKEPRDEENVRIIGNSLNDIGGIGLMMMCHYLLAWDIKCGGMLVGSYTRVVEHWWDGIGDWMA